MSKKSEILRIWQECFPKDTPQWRRMFFDAAYSDEEALTATDPISGQTVSSLLLLSYAMTFQGKQPGVAYIYGAGTLRKHRAQGHMTRLLQEALQEALDRGDTFAALIPASEGLRRYYERFGFATVFYRTPTRFTSIHRFPYTGSYVDLSQAAPAGLYPAFERMMGKRDECVQHSRAQFLTLMDDCRLSGYGFAAVCRSEGNPAPCAMAWGAPAEYADDVIVRELLAEDEDSASAVLTLLQQQFPHRPLTIMSRPENAKTGGTLVPNGMIRIVNVATALSALAQAHPHLDITVKVRDSILQYNNGTYRLRQGELIELAPESEVKPNLDLTVTTLGSLLFSSTPIGEIMGIPSSRPYLSLMLD